MQVCQRPFLVVRAPGGFGTTDDFNSGNVIAFLRPWEDRSITTAEVATIINKVIADQPGVRGNAAPRSGLGRGPGLPFNLVPAGATYQGIAAAPHRLIAAPTHHPGPPTPPTLPTPTRPPPLSTEWTPPTSS